LKECNRKWFGLREGHEWDYHHGEMGGFFRKCKKCPKHQVQNVKGIFYTSYYWDDLIIDKFRKKKL